MSHVNINKPKSEYSHDFTLSLEMAKLRVELDLWKSRAGNFEKDLNSIFERVSNGEAVYLCQDNGDIIYIGKVEEPSDE